MHTGESHRDKHSTSINTFPDNVFLEIFYIYRRNQDLYGCHFHPIWDWHNLAHVCSRWRRIILSSPRRLDLHLLCTYETPVRKNLGCLPLFPLIIDYSSGWGADGKSLTPRDEDNIIAALEEPGRVQYVEISVTSSLLKKMDTDTRKSFSRLTHICLSSKEDNVVALPNQFSKGSAPNLRVAHLDGIQFPAFPTLLSSALGLVDLRLLNIPLDGYISPEAMVTSLAAFTGLKTLLIGFKSPTRPTRTIIQDPIKRTALPSLTTFGFHGVKEYLEDLVAQIDAPQLGYFRISYFNQLEFHVPKLSKFIHRTQSLCLARFQRARVDFGLNNVYVSLYCGQEELLDGSHFSLQISCRGLDWQVSHAAQTLAQSGAMLFNVDDLAIDTRADMPPLAGGKDFMDDSEWLALLRPFTAVTTLHVSWKLAEHVACGLEGVTEETAAELLPALQSLCLEGAPLTSAERFSAIRQLSGLPVTITGIDEPLAGEFFERLESPSELESDPYPDPSN